MAKGVRYYLNELDEVGVTPSRLARMGREKQLQYAQHWFRQYYEDPAEETPRDEGEFVYIWGGPYDALDELGSEFAGILSDDRIQEAAKLMEDEGPIDWAPTSNHPDHRSVRVEEIPDEPEVDPLDEILARIAGGNTATFGGALELAERAALLRYIDALEAELSALKSPAPSKGHNNPPPDDEDEPTISDVMAALAAMRAEFQKAIPDVAEVAEKAGTISRAKKWLSGQMVKTFERGFQNAVLAGVMATSLFAAGVASPHVIPLLQNVEHSAIRWLYLVMGIP